MQKLSLLKTLTLCTVSSVFLAGCSQQQTILPATETVETQIQEQPPVTSSTETEDLKTELDGTVILEDDFSDL